MPAGRGGEVNAISGLVRVKVIRSFCALIYPLNFRSPSPTFYPNGSKIQIPITLSPSET